MRNGEKDERGEKKNEEKEMRRGRKIADGTEQNRIE